jgi:uncharacterized protein YjcR
MAMQTISQFIVDLGGTVAVADALGVPPSTVSSWKTSNSIPHWRMEKLSELAKERSVELPRAAA